MELPLAAINRVNPGFPLNAEGSALDRESLVPSKETLGTPLEEAYPHLGCSTLGGYLNFPNGQPRWRLLHYYFQR